MRASESLTSDDKTTCSCEGGWCQIFLQPLQGHAADAAKLTTHVGKLLELDDLQHAAQHMAAAPVRQHLGLGGDIYDTKGTYGHEYTCTKTCCSLPACQSPKPARHTSSM